MGKDSTKAAITEHVTMSFAFFVVTVRFGFLHRIPKNLDADIPNNTNEVEVVQNIETDRDNLQSKEWSKE